MSSLNKLQTGLSPERVIVTDWYDGAIAGVVEYPRVGTVHFELVGDLLEEPSCFLLRESTLDTLERVALDLHAFGSPRWPVWVLGPIPMTAETTVVYERIFRVDGPPPIMAMVETRGIRHEIIRLRLFEDESLRAMIGEKLAVSPRAADWRLLLNT